MIISDRILCYKFACCFRVKAFVISGFYHFTELYLFLSGILLSEELISDPKSKTMCSLTFLVISGAMFAGLAYYLYVPFPDTASDPWGKMLTGAGFQLQHLVVILCCFLC